MFLDVSREQDERQAQTDRSPRWCKLRNCRRPRERFDGVGEGIDNEIQYKVDNFALEQQMNLFEIVDKGTGFQGYEGQRETAGIQPTASHIPDFSKPAAELTVRLAGKRTRLLAESI